MTRRMRWGIPCLALAMACLPDGIPACQRTPRPPPPPPPPPAIVPDEPWVPEETLLECVITASPQVVTAGQPFAVELTLRNYAARAPYPPLFENDRLFTVRALGTDSDGDGLLETPPTCAQTGLPAGLAQLDWSPQWVALDDAWAPSPDGPTSASFVFNVTPEAPADRYSVVLEARSLLASGHERRCVASVCVPAAPDPASLPTPTAELLVPRQEVAAGGAASFDMRVHRNGYPIERPLTVRVIPTNTTDAIDIFPLAPGELATTGVTVTGTEELVSFQCTSHYPCFPGVSNEYRITIHDGATLLWESGEAGFVGRTVVSSAPMARLELVELTAAGCDGSLLSCEQGMIHLRLFARAPGYATHLRDATLELPLPAGLDVMAWQMHFHDNPMDTVTPTPAELLASGVVTTTAGTLRIDVPSIEPRFTGAPDVPPTVFRDLFEVELFLVTPLGGMGSDDDIVFPGLTVAGTAWEERLSETTPPLVIPVDAAMTSEVSPEGSAQPLRFGADKRTITWQDCEPLSADTFNVYRGVLGELREGTHGSCYMDRLVDPTVTDPALPGAGSGFFYLVAAVNCAGQGSLGSTSLGAPRMPARACP